MNDSNDITKKILAESLKNLLKRKPLHKVSVGEIVLECNLSRQTFYTHFCDKYELVNYLGELDFSDIIEEYNSNRDFTQMTISTMELFNSNKSVYLHLLDQITSQNSFFEFFLQFNKKQMMKYVNQSVISKELEMSIYIYCLGSMMVIYKWLKGDIKGDMNEIAELIVKGMSPDLKNILLSS